MLEIISNFIKDNIFSILTAIVAFIAIAQTNKQIKLSNKQFLFNKRLEKYIMTKSLIELYRDNKSILDYSDSEEDAIIVDFQFEMLTNIGYLKDITKIIYDPTNNDEKIKFLLKLEDIKKLANEMKFLFKSKKGNFLKEYLYNYQNLLLELYKYQILQDLMKNNKLPGEPKTYKELQKIFGEGKYRKRLYTAIKLLKNSFDNLEKNNVMYKVEKDIKL